MLDVNKKNLLESTSNDLFDVESFKKNEYVSINRYFINVNGPFETILISRDNFSPTLFCTFKLFYCFFLLNLSRLKINAISNQKYVKQETADGTLIDQWS